MKSTEYLEEVVPRCKKHVEAFDAAVSGISLDKLNQKQLDGWWSIAQIIDHMTIADGLYLPPIKRALSQAPRNGGTDILKHSFIGGMIAKFAGPEKDATPPSVMLPAQESYDESVIQHWKDQMNEILGLMENAKGVELTKVKIKNPVVKWFSMNLYDCFEIIAVHTDRHVGQIRQLVKTE